MNFLKRVANEVAKNTGKAISTKVFKNSHATPHKIIRENVQSQHNTKVVTGVSVNQTQAQPEQPQVTYEHKYTNEFDELFESVTFNPPTDVKTIVPKLFKLSRLLQMCDTNAERDLVRVKGNYGLTILKDAKDVNIDPDTLESFEKAFKVPKIEKDTLTIILVGSVFIATLLILYING